MSISKERPINATRHVPGVSKRGKSVVSYQFLLGIIEIHSTIQTYETEIQ